VNLYLDSSSLLKLFLDEDGSRQVNAQVTTAGSLSTSLVSWPEVRAGLARAQRGLRVSPDDYQSAVSRFSTDIWPRFEFVDFTVPLAHKAGDLAARYFLRGLDAIHLASAVTLRDELDESVSFSAFDGRLCEAAADCGLTVV
jgi:predicted nucleic acid-binding protein